jgi:predicted O-linked N-acetylglucosamine transferase (SPINDLY family)
MSSGQLVSWIIMAPNDHNPARSADDIDRLIDAGFAQHEAGRLDQAEALYREALAGDPKHAEALHLLGLVSFQRGEFQSAIELIECAIPELDDLPEAHLNLGNAMREVGRLTEAVGCYRRAIDLDPAYGMAHSNLAHVLNEQGLFEAGLESSRRALELIPDFLGAHVNCAAALLGLERFAEAEAPLRRAVVLAPDKAEGHRDLGEVLVKLGRLDEAVVSYHRALDLNPTYARVHHNLGNALKAQGKLSEAVACFERAVALDPEDADGLAGWFRERQNICDWTDYGENEARTRQALMAQPSLGAPLTLLAFASSLEAQLACARQVAAKIAVPAIVLPRAEPGPGERVRLGYLSADFRSHPVGFLVAGLIERHDRQHFEVIGYCCGPDDGSATRARLTRAFDRFIDVKDMSHPLAARRIHDDGVDILVDLTGFTAHGRTAILAHRPASIQVNYLGYPGTMGADFIDYIIVDRFLAPIEHQPFYTERLVQLPHCYQPSELGQQVADRTPSRVECGLPERGFVFCCFNTSYKLTPTFFDIWMRLLNALPGSVLWLVAANPFVIDNLRREAVRRGVAAERLVFGAPTSRSEYLARLRLADLFLDTLPYNAGATASDALWAGLPVLTCSGETYVGRMAGALLTAAELPQLITTSLEAYERLALRLATEPGFLAGLRQRLIWNRPNVPLFDIGMFTRGLERAYTQMRETWKAGRPPTAFSVPPSAAN